MKYLLISLLLGLGLTTHSITLADSGQESWEEVKAYCKKGAINKQDRAHKPTVTCDYIEESGTYEETQVKKYYYNKVVTDPTYENFVSTFSTDKSKATRAYQRDKFTEADIKETEVDKPATTTCFTTKKTVNIRFVYDRPDTCKLMKEYGSTPRTFCDYVKDKVLTDAERKKATRPGKEMNEEDAKKCRHEKGGKY